MVTAERVRPASLRIRGGVIAALGGWEEPSRGASLFDFGESVVMPGLVDTHVHINEPGRTDWEGFETATRAAAAGGITTLVDMPLNSIPPTITLEGLHAKREAAFRRCFVDVGFWGGVVPGNEGEIPRLLEAGVFGFKAFLVPSGVPEFEHVAETRLRAALPKLAQAEIPLLVHAEAPERIAEKWVGDPRRYASYLASRPPEAEIEAVALLVRLCRETRARIHVLHLSSSGVLPSLRQARLQGLPITAETCPHYLFFAAEEIADGATEYKCAPPIRGGENRERLWAALKEGLIEMVVSDHSPSPPNLKCRDSGDFQKAWGGISSLELLLPATWTAARQRGCSLEDLADWLCAAPAKLAGLEDRKGAFAPGRDADFVVWNPEARWEVDGARLHHRHKLTPYAGQFLYGVVEATYLRGEKIYDRGGFAAPSGRLLRRGR